MRAFSFRIVSRSLVLFARVLHKSYCLFVSHLPCLGRITTGKATWKERAGPGIRCMSIRHCRRKDVLGVRSTVCIVHGLRWPSSPRPCRLKRRGPSTFPPLHCVKAPQRCVPSRAALAVFPPSTEMDACPSCCCTLLTQTCSCACSEEEVDTPSNSKPWSPTTSANPRRDQFSACPQS